MTMYDAADIVTTIAADSVKNVIEVSLRKLINGVSTNMILVAKTTTTSTISVEMPDAV